MKIAINGFGRIGRMVCQAALLKGLDVIAVNDLTDTKTLAHLFQHDSVHGKYKGKVSCDKENVIIDGKKIRVFAEKDPETLPWKKLNIDVVVESTGRFLTTELASKHIRAGAKKVLLSAPGKDSSIKTIVLGVNEKDIKKTDLILSNASCTTNSIAPVIKALHKKFGIAKGLLTTVHSYTADQVLVDGPHSDLRRARAAAINIIPTTTGAAKSVAEAIPEMKGKLDGRAIRVPTSCGSITDFTAELKKKTTASEVNKAIKEIAMKELKGIVEYSEEELVSSDIVGNAHSAIYDSQLTLVQGGNLVKVFTWYDNEWGYSNRMIDIIKLMK
jgi:glyceraldehyde 3-phosphate dehydrogenase